LSLKWKAIQNGDNGKLENTCTVSNKDGRNPSRYFLDTFYITKNMISGGIIKWGKIWTPVVKTCHLHPECGQKGECPNFLPVITDVFQQMISA